MATLTWAAVDDDAAPGDPAAFAALAQVFSDTASGAGKAKDLLERFRGAVDERIWKGEAADAFRAHIEKLPAQLGKLAASHATAVEGMASYGRVLEDLQRQAATLRDQGQAASDERLAHERSRDAALSAGPAVATTAYEDAIAEASQRAQRVDAEIEHLRDRRKEAESAAVQALERAHDLGIKNDPWYAKAWHSVDRWIDDHADLIRTLSTVLKTVSAIAGLLSFIPFLAPICGPIAFFTGLAALGVDATLCATGNGNWKSLAVDAALMAVPAVGGRLRAAVSEMRVGRAAARGVRFTEVPYGKVTNLSRRAVAYRKVEGLRGGNVAVARYRSGMGFTKTMAASSERSTFTHAETALMDKLAAKGVKASRVEEMYSELEFCNVPNWCKRIVPREFLRSKLSYSFEYGKDFAPRSAEALASRKAGVQALAEAVAKRVP